jgi:hypothetical protein
MHELAMSKWDRRRLDIVYNVSSNVSTMDQSETNWNLY